MTPKISAIALATALVLASINLATAQAPADTPPQQQNDVRRDRDFDFGWLGLIGLLGLGGLAGRRRDMTVGTTRRPT